MIRAQPRRPEWLGPRAVVTRARDLWAWVSQTLPLRALKRYNDLRGNRLAGAMSFYGFISLFPLLLLGAAAASLLAPENGEQVAQDLIDDNIPGLEFSVAPFFDNAGTLSIIGAATLLYTGLGWVDCARAAVRSMWQLDDQPGNLVVRKAIDVVALAGLGILTLASFAVSVGLSELAEQVLDFVGISGSWGKALLFVVSAALGILVTSVLFAYMLSGLPRIRMPLTHLAWISLLGGVAFEVLRRFLVGFVTGAAARNAYAAFAVPLALLAWIYVVTRLLMSLAAITAEANKGASVAQRSGPSDDESGDASQSP